jgi:hypothetical protein
MSYFLLIINNVFELVKASRGFSFTLIARSEKRSEVAPLSATADSDEAKPADNRHPG